MDVIANGIRLHYLESGLSTGFPVILLHGNGLNHEMWRHLEPVLDAAAHRVITPHFRGMGVSEAPGFPGVTWTIDDHAADLVAFLDALEIERAALVAHAFGGFVAMQVAVDRPERVASLVVVDASASVEGKTRDGLPAWADKAERLGMAPLVEPAMDRWFVERVRSNPATMDLYRRMVAANPPLGYAANCRGIPQFDLRGELGRITAPTLVIGGTEDYSISLQQKRDLAEGIPGARFVEVTDASHTVPEEQPELFNFEVLEFLRSTRAPLTPQAGVPAPG